MPSIKIDPFDNVYRINIHDISATCDADGNVIATTYATVSDLDNKLDKTSDGLKIYATDDIGNQTTVDYTDDTLPNAIAQRNASGNLTGHIPTSNDEYATKGYVDNKAEVWTFTLDDGSVITKNVLVN